MGNKGLQKRTRELGTPLIQNELDETIANHAFILDSGLAHDILKGAVFQRGAERGNPVKDFFLQCANDEFGFI